MTQKKVIARLKRITTKERFSIARKLKRKGFHMKQKSSFLLLLLFLMFSSNGCSLIGYGIGSAIDSGQPQKYKYKKIGELQSGDRMRVIRRDSTIIEGRYRGMAADGMLPLKESIVIESKGEELTIPLNDVTRVGKLQSRNAKWIGLGVGFGFDVAAIMVIIEFNNSFSAGYGEGVGGFQGPW